MGFDFGINLFGTISFTALTVGANGLGFFGGLGCSFFRCVSVVGKVFIRIIPFAGRRSGSNSPSSRRASHSWNVGNFMVVGSRFEATNNKNRRSRNTSGPGRSPVLTFFRLGRAIVIFATRTALLPCILFQEPTRPAPCLKYNSPPSKARKA